MQVCIDALGRPSSLNDDRLIARVLDKIPELIAMTIIPGTKQVMPFVSDHGGRGWQGIILIAESHITIHALPREKRIFIDIFSCKDFDSAIAVEYLTRQFHLTEVKSTALDRGNLGPPTLEAVIDAETQARLKGYGTVTPTGIMGVR